MCQGKLSDKENVTKQANSQRYIGHKTQLAGRKFPRKAHSGTEEKAQQVVCLLCMYKGPTELGYLVPLFNVKCDGSATSFPVLRNE